jgi:3D (Asp-Asp-Asp) domain-containing protein
MTFRKAGYGVFVLALLLGANAVPQTTEVKQVFQSEDATYGGTENQVDGQNLIQVAVDTPLSSYRTLRAMLEQAQKEELEAKTEAELLKDRPVEVSRGSTPVEVLEGFQVTYYNNDNITHTTKSGAPTVDGVTVGVDPNIIPLGSTIEIHMPDGRILKRVAQDTGSAVKGRVLDVYADQPRSVLLKWGRVPNATVKILKRG